MIGTFDFVPRVGSNPTMTSQELVDWMLGIHNYWFTDKENLLFGKRDELAAGLLHYIEIGEEPDNASIAVIYVIGKFSNDVEPLFTRRVRSGG